MEKHNYTLVADGISIHYFEYNSNRHGFRFKHTSNGWEINKRVFIE